MRFGISTSPICWSGWAFLGKVYLKVRRATLFWLLFTSQYLFATLVLASPTCNRRCNGVYSSAVKERPSDQRYARWECKRPSGEWGAGAAGAEPGPQGAGAARRRSAAHSRAHLLELKTRGCSLLWERARTAAGCYSYHKMRAEPSVARPLFQPVGHPTVPAPSSPGLRPGLPTPSCHGHGGH